MSTRSYIAKQIDTNKYLTIYCHSDGYLTYNGAMLIDYYNTEEKVDALLKLGNISFLEKKLYPDPGKEHSFDYDKRQEGVVVAYGRDRGDKDSEAFVAAMEDLDDPNNWTEYVYIFTLNNEQKYFKSGHSNEGLRDVKEDLKREYAKYGLENAENYCGFLSEDIAEQLKPEQENDNQQNNDIHSDLSM